MPVAIKAHEYGLSVRNEQAHVLKTVSVTSAYELLKSFVVVINEILIED